MANPPVLPLQTQVFQSSYIHSATYDPNRQTLEVRFANGKVFASPENPEFPAPVPLDVWTNFVKSGSPGQFFIKEIRPYWAGEEVKPLKPGGNG